MNESNQKILFNQINSAIVDSDPAEKINFGMQCIVYFSRRKSEFFDFSNDEIFENIEKLFEEIAMNINDQEWKTSKQSTQLLIFTLIIFLRQNMHSRNVRYVEEKLKFYNKHPSFILTVLMQIVNQEIKNLNLFPISGTQYFVKTFELLSAEVLITPFLDKIQPLLFNHSKQLLEANHLAPFSTTYEVESAIKNISAILLTKLSTLIFE